MPPAEPASVPTVSEPQPTMPLEIRYWMLRGRAGRVRAFGVGVEEFGFAAVALVPVGAHHHPATGRDRAVLFLPGFDAVDGQEEIGILRAPREQSIT